MKTTAFLTVYLLGATLPMAYAIQPTTASVTAKGAGPHRLLTFDDTQKGVTTFELRTTMAAEILVSGHRMQRLESPTVRHSVEVYGRSKDATSIRYSQKIKAIEALPTEGVNRANLRSTQQTIASEWVLGPARDRKMPSSGAGRLAIDSPYDDRSLGYLKDIVVGAHDGLNSLAAPFPSEPIGQGAAWVAESTVFRNRAKLKKTVAYRLTALTGREAVIAVEVKLSLLSNADESRPPLHESFEGTGKGEVVLSLDDIVPLRGRLQMTEQEGSPPQGATQMQHRWEYTVELSRRG